MLDESNENEIKHDPFEFPHDDKIFFSRLLSNLTIWQAQKFNNGDPNLSMPLLKNDVQVFNAPPQAIHAPMAPSQDTSM